MGKIWLIGAGPGDPDLITVKGLRAIQQADVILYDRLVNPVLLTHAKKEARLLYCGKTPHQHSLSQATIQSLLVKYAKRDQQVVRLKGGDPFVFGRGGEEAAYAAAHRIAFEVVPGITAGIAAPAYAGIPVTHRTHSASFAIVTGHRKAETDDQEMWKALATGIDTIAIYMGVQNISVIQRQLLQYGKSPATPVALIHWGTTEAQRTVTGTLGTLSKIAKQISNPSMIIIGEVVRLREQLQWFTERTATLQGEAL